jgi:phosphoribosylamine--glycine ligase
MRILVLSHDFSGASLCHRLAREGHEVRVHVADAAQAGALEGIVSKAANRDDGLDWVGRDGLVIADDVGFGRLQNELRAQGYAVVGGSAGGDRLEEDRPYCQRVLADCGIAALPTAHFATAADAIAHVRAHPGPWVIKQNGHPESIVCYVGRMEDGADVVDLLRHYAERYGDRGGYVLQRRCQGIEIGVGRYFNGRRWAGPIELNVEHKKLCAGDVGPKTYEMGTLMWYEADEAQPLFRATLAKLEPYLRQADFRGDVDINCIVNAEGAFPLEVTARFGYPAVQAQMELHATPWGEFLHALAQGRDGELDWRPGYSLSGRVAAPPFPYHGPGDRADLSPRGLKIHFRRPMTEEDWRHLHPEEVSRWPDGEAGEEYVVAGDGGYVMHVSGFGASVEAAREATYGRICDIAIPRMFYRTDLGLRFADRERAQLQQWGWL